MHNALDYASSSTQQISGQLDAQNLELSKSQFIGSPKIALVHIDSDKRCNREILRKLSKMTSPL